MKMQGKLILIFSAISFTGRDHRGRWRKSRLRICGEKAFRQFLQRI